MSHRNAVPMGGFVPCRVTRKDTAGGKPRKAYFYRDERGRRDSDQVRESRVPQLLPLRPVVGRRQGHTGRHSSRVQVHEVDQGATQILESIEPAASTELRSYPRYQG